MKPRQRRKFWTGMITLGDEPFQPAPPFNGAGWQATLEPQRTNPQIIKSGEEVVIHASSWISAQRALNLIHNCHRLFLGEPDILETSLIANNADEPDWMDEHIRKSLLGKTYATLNFPLACAVAAKASRRRNWVYAVAKYAFSLSTYPVHPMDLHPWGSPHLAVSKIPGDHVLMSHAIIAAYSVVEELELMVKASSQRPSRIDGKWNLPVKLDLEHRLTKAGIDLGETLLWTVRGPKRKIEKRRAVPTGTKAPWSAWTVRDSEIPIVDAISYAEWLRSCVASHAAKDLTQVLSPYDVTNVQHVARRLLLESLGFWRWKQQQIKGIRGNP